MSDSKATVIFYRGLLEDRPARDYLADSYRMDYINDWLHICLGEQKVASLRLSEVKEIHLTSNFKKK